MKYTLSVVLFLLSFASHASYQELLEVHAKVNTSFYYATDLALYGKEDHWASVSEFEKRQAGDCEDFALYKSHLLKKRGIKHALAYFYKNGQAHIAVIAEIDGKLYLSDIHAKLVPINMKTIKQKEMIVATVDRFLKKFA